ncbi:MAG TPA: SPOR domain-containing protein [Bacteroidota bacterium]|nr:SPOR domain-containing protein [Bacteroidota bacterium]
MSTRRVIILSTCMLLLMAFIGCSSSQDTEGQGDVTKSPPPVQKQSNTAQQVSDTVKTTIDTTKTAVSNNQPPPQTKQVTQQTRPMTNSGMPVGRFSVQIGAFSLPDKANQLADMTRGRVSKTVYVFLDNNTNMTKVTVGDFDVKDDARAFRDQLIQQFPDDYKGAWVFEVPHN